NFFGSYVNITFICPDGLNFRFFAWLQTLSAQNLFIQTRFFQTLLFKFLFFFQTLVKTILHTHQNKGYLKHIFKQKLKFICTKNMYKLMKNAALHLSLSLSLSLLLLLFMLLHHLSFTIKINNSFNPTQSM